MPGSGANYPPIADHALIGDCHSAALVSTGGTIDWCCLPRFDSPSVFGALLDSTKGGRWDLDALQTQEVRRRYLEGTLVLETTLATSTGEAIVTDLFSMREGGRSRPRRELLRFVHGARGRVEFSTLIAPRFDYGETSPWVREHEGGVFSLVGSSNGLVIWSDVHLRMDGEHALRAEFAVETGEQRSFSLRFEPPEDLVPEGATAAALDAHRAETIDWWQGWSDAARIEGPRGAGALRSAIVLKAMTYAPSGAMIAAPTTSLPESSGGSRNWDYRYSWIRDSTFAVRALDELGFGDEANGFRRFIERSAAGNAHELQVLYGVGGERRLPEVALDHLEGYAGARPVRVGNRAAGQFQLDIFGELMDLAWEWHLRGHSPRGDYWRFLKGIVEEVERRWREPDRGIWEIRGDPQQFVHSKMMCWVALDRAIKLTDGADVDGDAAVERWVETREEIRSRIEGEGYDHGRGVFRRAFGSDELDAALLLLPQFGFVGYTDPRMLRTADAISDDLSREGLISRYVASDGLDGNEGTFIACTFWLAECFARQGKDEEALTVFQRAESTANDLGLFAEEFDPERGEMLGNFPQGLTHLAHIGAAAALAGREPADRTSPNH